jgi:hypothetical protein
MAAEARSWQDKRRLSANADKIGGQGHDAVTPTATRRPSVEQRSTAGGPQPLSVGGGRLGSTAMPAWPGQRSACPINLASSECYGSWIAAAGRAAPRVPASCSASTQSTRAGTSRPRRPRRVGSRRLGQGRLGDGRRRAFADESGRSGAAPMVPVAPATKIICKPFVAWSPPARHSHFNILHPSYDTDNKLSEANFPVGKTFATWRPAE